MIKKFFHQFASPKSYFSIANKFGKPVLATFFLLYISALVWGLFFTPPDAVQGDSYRIIYMHVPASFMAQILFVVMAITSAVFLIWKLKLAAYVSKSIAPIGAIAMIKYAASLTLQIKYVMLDIAIAKYNV